MKYLLIIIIFFIILSGIIPINIEKRIIEQLDNPVYVIEILKECLILKGRSNISIYTTDANKYYTLDNIVFKHALSRGIEFSQDGYIYGILDIWHWSGNDPVRQHLARVNLNKLIYYLNNNNLDDEKGFPPSYIKFINEYHSNGWLNSIFINYKNFSLSEERYPKLGGCSQKINLEIKG